MGSERRAKLCRRLERERQTVDGENRLKTQQKEIEARFDSFEKVLADCKIKIPPGSKLEQALLLAPRLRYISLEGASPPHLTPKDEDDMFRRAAWIWAIAPKVVAATRHRSFDAIVPHLRLVVDGEFAQTVLSDQSEASDKLFELVVALAVLPSVRDLRMDTGKATNPDLLFEFQGTCWAIACKAIYSKRPETYRDHVAKGARQIEQSGATRGVVCVSLRNHIRQELFMPRDGTKAVGMPKEDIETLVDAEGARIRRELIEPVAKDIVSDLKTRSKTENDVLHVIAGCARSGSPNMPRMTSFVRIMNVGSIDAKFADMLHCGLQPEY